MSAETKPRPRFTVTYAHLSWPGIDETFDTDDLAEAMEAVFDQIQQGRKVKMIARKAK